jgi:hypothetical protein
MDILLCSNYSDLYVYNVYAPVAGLCHPLFLPANATTLLANPTHSLRGSQLGASVLRPARKTCAFKIGGPIWTNCDLLGEHNWKVISTLGLFDR